MSKAYQAGVMKGIDLMADGIKDDKEIYNEGFNDAIRECYNLVADYSGIIDDRFELAHIIKGLSKEAQAVGK
jgi:hypothetical protein